MPCPVLIVDDNRLTCDALEFILRLRGHETVTANDGLDALGYLRDGGVPCVIVLDIRMPNMDGVAFNRELRSDPRWASIPVVVYSAVPPADVEGAAAIIRKGSANPEVLIRVVETACPR